MSRCYLCGSTENLTRDHIPPESFFPPPKPTNLITVPCCEKCHKPLCLQDEAFRVWVAAAADKSPAGHWIWEQGVVESSFKRSPKLFDNVRKHVQMSQFRLPDRIVEVPTITIPKERAKIVLIRITKGLLTHFYPQYNFSKDVFKVACPAPIPEHQENIHSLMRVGKHVSRGDGVFDFWHGFTVEKNGGFWVYFFYQTACCVVTHSSALKSAD